MQMQYWKNINTNEVFGYDLLDQSQIEAMNQRLSVGNWQDITMNWPLPPPPPTAEQNKAKAVQLLSETDWVNQPDVIDPNVNPHLLNQPAFITYRAALRAIAINPQAGDLDWPTKPQEQWS